MKTLHSITLALLLAIAVSSFINIQGNQLTDDK